jgi:hypothetical protein
MRRLQVKGESGLVRDVQSRALLFTDAKAVEAYRKKKAQNEEINTLKTEVAVLKNLVQRLIERQENQ